MEPRKYRFWKFVTKAILLGFLIFIAIMIIDISPKIVNKITVNNTKILPEYHLEWIVLTIGIGILIGMVWFWLFFKPDIYRFTGRIKDPATLVMLLTLIAEKIKTNKWEEYMELPINYKNLVKKNKGEKS